MTGEEFEARVATILAEHGPGHAAHRALDELTNELLISMGGGYARGTAKWLAVIEGQHVPGRPYPIRPDTPMSALPEDDGKLRTCKDSLQVADDEKLIAAHNEVADRVEAVGSWIDHLDMDETDENVNLCYEAAAVIRVAGGRIETLSREIERAHYVGRYEERADIVAWIRRAAVSAWEDRPEGKLFSDLATDIENEEHASLTTGSAAGEDEKT